MIRFGKWVAAKVNGLKHAKKKRKNTSMVLWTPQWTSLLIVAAVCNCMYSENCRGKCVTSHFCWLSSWIWLHSPQRWRIWSKCSWILWLEEKDHTKRWDMCPHTHCPASHIWCRQKGWETTKHWRWMAEGRRKRGGWGERGRWGRENDEARLQKEKEWRGSEQMMKGGCRKHAAQRMT